MATKNNSKAKPDDLSGGCLYVVATPIGNLEDISLRALRILKEADVIACEDTRQTQKLLSHFDIPKRLVSYHEHNEITRAAELVIELEQGAKVALVSDAGTPAISDPGYRLVSLCLRHGVEVVPVPGSLGLRRRSGGLGNARQRIRLRGISCRRGPRLAARPFAISQPSREPSRSTKRRIACSTRSRTRSKSWAIAPR